MKLPKIWTKNGLIRKLKIEGLDPVEITSLDLVYRMKANGVLVGKDNQRYLIVNHPNIDHIIIQGYGTIFEKIDKKCNEYEVEKVVYCRWDTCTKKVQNRSD